MSTISLVCSDSMSKLCVQNVNVIRSTGSRPFPSLCYGIGLGLSREKTTHSFSSLVDVSWMKLSVLPGGGPPTLFYGRESRLPILCDNDD